MTVIKKNIGMLLLILLALTLFGCSKQENFSPFQLANTDKIQLELSVVDEKGTLLEQNADQTFSLGNDRDLQLKITGLNSDYYTAVYFDQEQDGHAMQAEELTQTYAQTDKFPFLQKGRHHLQVIQYEPTHPKQALNQKNLRETQRIEYTIK